MCVQNKIGFCEVGGYIEAMLYFTRNLSTSEQLKKKIPSLAMASGQPQENRSNSYFSLFKIQIQDQLMPNLRLSNLDLKCK